jgi:hypothetical protein
MRRTVAAVVAAVAAVIAVNVLLLGYGGDRHDPVGRLSPVANLPAPAVQPPRAPSTTDGRRADD